MTLEDRIADQATKLADFATDLHLTYGRCGHLANKANDLAYAAVHSPEDPLTLIVSITAVLEILHLIQCRISTRPYATRLKLAQFKRQLIADRLVLYRLVQRELSRAKAPQRRSQIRL